MTAVARPEGTVRARPKNFGSARLALAPSAISTQEVSVNISFTADFGGNLAVPLDPQDKTRTIFALVAASVISLVVWGLVVALKVR